MGIFLMVVGYGWAVLGVANCFGTSWDLAQSGADATNAESLSVGLDIVMFVVPGLFVGIIGTTLHRKRASRMPCPYCKEDIKRSATVCPHCRTIIEQGPPGTNAQRRS